VPAAAFFLVAGIWLVATVMKVQACVTQGLERCQ
jgi:hypothetical protein